MWRRLRMELLPEKPGRLALVFFLLLGLGLGASFLSEPAAAANRQAKVNAVLQEPLSAIRVLSGESIHLSWKPEGHEALFHFQRAVERGEVGLADLLMRVPREEDRAVYRAYHRRMAAIGSRQEKDEALRWNRVVAQWGDSVARMPTMEADVLRRTGQIAKARQAYAEAFAMWESQYAFFWMLKLATLQGDRAALQELTAHPGFRSWAPLPAQAEVWEALQHWDDLLVTLFQVQVQKAFSYPGLAAFYLWLLGFALLILICQVDQQNWKVLGVGVMASLLGASATVLTLLGEAMHGGLSTLGAGLSEGDLLWESVTGLALREEASKLSFLALLAPALLLIRARRLHVIFASAALGLGFAASENTTYLMDVGTFPLFRFLFASFLHMFWAGITGYALMGLVRRRDGKALACLVLVFVSCLVAHGTWNAFSLLPSWAPYHLFSFLILLVTGWAFFHCIRQRRDPHPEARLQSAEAYVFAMGAVASVSLFRVAWHQSIWAAFEEFGSLLVGVALVGFFFLREFNRVDRGLDLVMHPSRRKKASAPETATLLPSSKGNW
ncbi:MAG: PrsW family glutamic-type intramembrane protease [Verrucomicrobiota bacterium]